MPIRMPKSTIVASAATLAASYAAVGSVVDIRGYGDLTLHVTAAGTGNTQLKVYVDPVSVVAPSDYTGTYMHQLCQDSDDPPAGVELVIVVNTGEKLSIPLGGVSGNFLALAGQYSATDGSCTVVLTGNANTGGGATTPL